MPDRFKSYAEAAEYQLAEWVAGRPWHNPLSPVAGLEGGECCPDFSCCQPQLLAPEHLRQRFFDADDRTRSEMLSMFLGGLVNDVSEVKVHIAGDTPEEPH